MATTAKPLRYLFSNHTSCAIPNNPNDAILKLRELTNQDPHGSLCFPPIPNAIEPKNIYCSGRRDIPVFMEKVQLFYDTVYRELYPELAQIALF